MENPVSKPAERLADLMDFVGHWTINRQISDRLGPDARFEGEAQVLPKPDLPKPDLPDPVLWKPDATLRYVERGTLHLGAQSFQAERIYLWSAPRPGLIDVSFPDGRPFHSFTLRNDDLAPEGDGRNGRSARHYCDPDIYDVTYDFADWPAWSSTWTVAGPRKDYTIRSRYQWRAT